MKWPTYLVLLRHAESQFNKFKKTLENDPQWQAFVAAYEADFQSEKTKHLAGILQAQYKNLWRDRKISLTQYGREVQAVKAGAYLKTQIDTPDVILVSPYERCLKTLDGLRQGWPELENIPTYQEECLVERSIGLCLLYAHWRIFHVFHPEQKELYEQEGCYDYRYPQGDNMRDVNLRMKDLFDTIIREFHGKKVLGIAHGVSIMGFRTAQERLTEAEFVELEQNNSPKNCSITLYRGDPTQGNDGRLVLERYNETAPL